MVNPQLVQAVSIGNHPLSHPVYVGREADANPLELAMGMAAQQLYAAMPTSVGQSTFTNVADFMEAGFQYAFGRLVGNAEICREASGEVTQRGERQLQRSLLNFAGSIAPGMISGECQVKFPLSLTENEVGAIGTKLVFEHGSNGVLAARLSIGLSHGRLSADEGQVEGITTYLTHSITVESGRTHVNETINAHRWTRDLSVSGPKSVSVVESVVGSWAGPLSEDLTLNPIAQGMVVGGKFTNEAAVHSSLYSIAAVPAGIIRALVA